MTPEKLVLLYCPVWSVFKNESTRTMCEICSNLEIKTPEKRHDVIFNNNFALISHIAPVFPI